MLLSAVDNESVYFLQRLSNIYKHTTQNVSAYICKLYVIYMYKEITFNYIKKFYVITNN